MYVALYVPRDNDFLFCARVLCFRASLQSYKP